MVIPVPRVRFIIRLFGGGKEVLVIPCWPAKPDQMRDPVRTMLVYPLLTLQASELPDCNRMFIRLEAVGADIMRYLARR